MAEPWRVFMVCGDARRVECRDGPIWVVRTEPV